MRIEPCFVANIRSFLHAKECKVVLLLCSLVLDNRDIVLSLVSPLLGTTFLTSPLAFFTSTLVQRLEDIESISDVEYLSD